VADAIKGSGRMRSNISGSEALAILWAMTGSDWYSQFVFQTGWTPDRYEEWLGVALINPAPGAGGRRSFWDEALKGTPERADLILAASGSATTPRSA
jgi:hypothetical protein